VYINTAYNTTMRLLAVLLQLQCSYAFVNTPWKGTVYPVPKVEDTFFEVFRTENIDPSSDEYLQYDHFFPCNNCLHTAEKATHTEWIISHCSYLYYLTRTEADKNIKNLQTFPGHVPDDNTCSEKTCSWERTFSAEAVQPTRPQCTTDQCSLVSSHRTSACTLQPLQYSVAPVFDYRHMQWSGTELVNVPWKVGLDPDETTTRHETTMSITLNMRRQSIIVFGKKRINKYTYTIKSISYHQCGTGASSSQLQNIMALIAPVCLNDNICTSYYDWRVRVLGTMPAHNNAADRDAMLSRQYVNFQIPSQTELYVYSSMDDCIGRTSDLGTPIRAHRYQLHAADLHTYAWRVKLSSATDNCGTGCLDVDKKRTALLESSAMGFPFLCSHGGPLQEIRQDRQFCNKVIPQWKNCAKNHYVLDYVCVRCDKATPSRTHGATPQLVCAKCATGSYFNRLFDSCVLIPRGFYMNDVLVWGFNGINSNLWSPLTRQWEPSGVAGTHYMEYYLEDKDNSILLLVPEDAYSDINDKLVSCDSSAMEINYRYRDNCGPGVGDPWLNDQGTPVKMSYAPRNVLLEVMRGGQELDCIPCGGEGVGEGMFNSLCRANQAGGQCEDCTATCELANNYLWHTKIDTGCRDDQAVTNTVCQKCDVMSTSENIFRIVLGCGFTILPRWDMVTGVPDTATCIYPPPSNPSKQCQDINNKPFSRSNNYKGRTSSGPMYLPYCPSGYFVKESCVITAHTPWRGECCSACQHCAANQQKVDNWQPCSGATQTDTEIGMCTDSCSTGFYQKDGMCKLCRAACF